MAVQFKATNKRVGEDLLKTGKMVVKEVTEPHALSMTEKEQDAGWIPDGYKVCECTQQS